MASSLFPFYLEKYEHNGLFIDFILNLAYKICSSSIFQCSAHHATMCFGQTSAMYGRLCVGHITGLFDIWRRTAPSSCSEFQSHDVSTGLQKEN